MGNLDDLKANWAGTLALNTVRDHRSGQVLGVTTRGFFIQPPGNWLFYISSEPQRGPLTINLGNPTVPLTKLDSGIKVTLDPDRITLPTLATTISLGEAAPWEPAPTPTGPASPVVPEQRLAKLAARVFSDRPEGGLSHLLPLLVDNSTRIHYKNYQQQAPFEALTGLVSRALSDKPFPLKDALTSTLGCGGGLTPAGDDFFIGLALALNRWPAPQARAPDQAQYNAIVIKTAYQRTTTLSANLIECATMGLADERLIAGIDWIMTGHGAFKQVVEGIISWGNDSGVAVLAGFGVALLAEIG